ncbi:MAG: type II toxin-antitoxin system HicA family toxin [Planctomycetota bacterium]|nr:type II toxin-antitoxin system HicA family toxin [Planctomycetota bacterium]
MSKWNKVRDRVLSGYANRNIAFSDLCGLLRSLGFQERISGGHFIYTREGIVEIINLQPRGNLAKPYQVRQVRSIIEKYKLSEISDDRTDSI